VIEQSGTGIALRADGIALHRAAVGDRYVMELMDKKGLTLGGESSDISSVGPHLDCDAIISALQVLAEMVRPVRACML